MKTNLIKLRKILLYGSGALIIVCGLFLFLSTIYYSGYNDAKRSFCSDLFEKDLISNSFRTHNLCFLILSLGVAIGLIINGFPFTVKIQNNYDNGDYSTHKK